jgi:hypothetical protein
MTDSPPDAPSKPRFDFLRNGESVPAQLDWEEGPSVARKAIGDALNARNVAFLLGAGCSSLKVEGKEKGIATMQPLAAEFCAASLAVSGGDDAPWVLTAEELSYLATPGIDLNSPEYSRNLERLMEVLHSLQFVLRRSAKPAHQERVKTIESIIGKAFLWTRCTDGPFAHGDHAVLDIYEAFYRKLILRDRSLPRPWVFTTNYDLFNETAMDRLGLPYANGFSGVVERRFNPATFRYALAEQLDLTSRKWSAVDGFVYALQSSKG